MSSPKVSPNVAFTTNLATVAAGLELGAAAIHKVMGGDAISNQIQGESQSVRDIQEMIGARLLKRAGV